MPLHQRGLAGAELAFDADDERTAADRAQRIAERATERAHVVGRSDVHER